MAKLTLTDLTNLSNEATAVAAINANNTSTETALENTLSRDGTSPNQMGASLDMNSNRIINLPEPATGSEPLRLSDANTLIAGGTIYTNPSGGGAGDVLAKASATDYDTEWVTQASLGVSTATQTALDAKIASSVLTTRGDILYRDATVPARLAKGATNTLLTMGADDPAWATLSDYLDSTIGSTRGMLLLRGSSSWGALAIGSASQVLTSDGTDPAWAASGGGDVVGPASATDNAVARYDLTTGKLLQDSVVTIGDTGNIVTSGTITQTAPNMTVGPAGTGAGDNAKIILEASSGTNSGASVQFKRNSVNLFQFGNQSGILGGTSDDFVIYSNVSGAGTNAAILVESATSNVKINAGIATPAGGSTAARLLFGTTSGFGIYYGSGAPTVSAGQGSIYLRSDGSSTSTRLYVNTTGSTTWTNVTTAA